MYFITTITKDFTNRTVGYFSDKETAIRRVKQNYIDIWETIYEYAVIQKFGEGIYPDLQEEVWFKFDIDLMEYTETTKPDIFGYRQINGIG